MDAELHAARLRALQALAALAGLATVGLRCIAGAMGYAWRRPNGTAGDCRWSPAMVTRNPILLATAMAGALGFMSGSAIAQPATAQVAKDQQEIRDYKLSMAVLERVAKANKAAAAASATSPARQRLAKQKAELEALEAKDDPSAAEQQRMMTLADEIARAEDDDQADDDSRDGLTITEYARRIDGTPALAAAIRSVGLSSREYATAVLALLEAGIAHAFMQQQALKQAPPGVSPHNLEFVRTHEKQIAALGILAQDGG